MKYITRAARLLVCVLGLSALGSITLAGLVAFRHMLATPQPLESPLPGEAHLYRWKHGHIFYKLLGRQDAPPMVLLHTPELAASAGEWASIMVALAKGYRVYAPDLLGFGLSDRPDIHYTADIYTQLTYDFLTNVVAEAATLVASRLACNYAIAVAASSPDLCARLVLLSPTASRSDHADMISRATAREVISRATARVSRATVSEVISRATARVAPTILETGLVKVLLYPLLVEMTRLSRRFGEATYVYATTHQFGAEHAPMAWLAGKLARDVSAEIENLQQPVLIIWGSGELQKAGRGRDKFWALGKRAIQREDAINRDPTEVVLLQQTGAAVHEELPESVVETILQWSAEPMQGASAPVKPQVKVEAYCMKCKEKRVMLNAHEIAMKNGRIAVHGDCEVCGSQLFRMGRLTPGYPQTPV